jgi:hypothetical protein
MTPDRNVAIDVGVIPDGALAALCAVTLLGFGAWRDIDNWMRHDWDRSGKEPRPTGAPYPRRARDARQGVRLWPHSVTRHVPAAARL